MKWDAEIHSRCVCKTNGVESIRGRKPADHLLKRGHVCMVPQSARIQIVADT